MATKKSRTLEIVVSDEEYRYLKSLLESEVFQLSGVVRIKRDVPEAKELSIAEKLRSQLENPRFATA